MPSLDDYLVLSAILFTIGTAGVFVRRNLITILLSIEIMLNAVNLTFVAFGRAMGSADGQIIVYAGAIMVLFLFVVMLLNAPHEDTELDEKVHPLLRPGPMRFGAALAVALLVELVWAVNKGGGEAGQFAGGSVASVGAIGRSLFTEYAFAFEVTSILILVAMVGAVVLARQEKGSGVVFAAVDENDSRPPQS